jgi:hypothetical protein
VIEYTVKVDHMGDRYWYLNGKLHREDGPAIEYADGSSSWWLNSKCHRKAGPAVEYPNGSRWWYLGGVKYTEEEFNKKTFAETIFHIGKRK